MTQKVLSGRCLCGSVHYECGLPIEEPTFCHCESCRRASGAHVVAWMTVRRDTFKFTRGVPRELASSAPVVRLFCGGCGTPLAYRHADAPETIDITIATLDDPGAVAPVDHLWMQDAIAWDRPGDGLPQYRTERSAAERFVRPGASTGVGGEVMTGPQTDRGLRRAP